MGEEKENSFKRAISVLVYSTRPISYILYGNKALTLEDYYLSDAVGDEPNHENS